MAYITRGGRTYQKRSSTEGTSLMPNMRSGLEGEGLNHRQLGVNQLWRAEYETLMLLGSCTNDFRVIKHNRSNLTGSSFVGFLHSEQRKKPISTALIVKKSIFLAEHTAQA